VLATIKEFLEVMKETYKITALLFHLVAPQKTANLQQEEIK